MAMANKKTARQEWEAMTAERQVEKIKDYIELDDNDRTRIYVYPIYAILPVLEEVDPETWMDFYLHVHYGDHLETAGGLALKDKLHYNTSNTGFSRSVKNIVEACIDITTDGEIVYNDKNITERLDIRQLEMLRDPVSRNSTYNLKTYLTQLAAASAAEGRATRAAIELKKPSLVINEFQKTTEQRDPVSPVLRKALEEQGVHPSRVVDYCEALTSSTSPVYQGGAPNIADYTAVLPPPPTNNGGPA